MSNRRLAGARRTLAALVDADTSSGILTAALRYPRSGRAPAL